MLLNVLIFIPGVLFLVLAMLSVFHRSKDAKTMKTKYAITAALGLLSLIVIFAVPAAGESTQDGATTISWFITFTLSLFALIFLGGKLIDLLMPSHPERGPVNN